MPLPATFPNSCGFCVPATTVKVQRRKTWARTRYSAFGSTRLSDICADLCFECLFFGAQFSKPRTPLLFSSSSFFPPLLNRPTYVTGYYTRASGAWSVPFPFVTLGQNIRLKSISCISTCTHRGGTSFASLEKKIPVWRAERTQARARVYSSIFTFLPHRKMQISKKKIYNWESFLTRTRHAFTCVFSIFTSVSLPSNISLSSYGALQYACRMSCVTFLLCLFVPNPTVLSRRRG